MKSTNFPRIFALLFFGLVQILFFAAPLQAGKNKNAEIPYEFIEKADMVRIRFKKTDRYLEIRNHNVSPNSHTSDYTSLLLPSGEDWPHVLKDFKYLPCFYINGQDCTIILTGLVTNYLLKEGRGYIKTDLDLFLEIDNSIRKGTLVYILSKNAITKEHGSFTISEIEFYDTQTTDRYPVYSTTSKEEMGKAFYRWVREHVEREEE